MVYRFALKVGFPILKSMWVKPAMNLRNRIIHCVWQRSANLDAVFSERDSAMTGAMVSETRNAVVRSGTPEAGRSPVVLKKLDGYYVYQQGDDNRYWDMFLRFRRGELAGRRLSNHARERDVFLVEEGGRKYVIKWDRGGWGFGGESRPERFLLKLLRGPFYSRLMRRVRLARRSGLDCVQDIYLVAEKRTLHYCHEAVIILDYLEGSMLKEAADVDSYRPAIRNAMLDLHAHGLALCDVSPYNYLVDGDGVKIIDLVCRGNPRVDRVKDIIRLKNVLEIDLPLAGWRERALHWFLSRFQTARKKYVDKKNRKRAPKRLRYFRS